MSRAIQHFHRRLFLEHQRHKNRRKTQFVMWFLPISLQFNVIIYKKRNFSVATQKFTFLKKTPFNYNTARMLMQKPQIGAESLILPLIFWKLKFIVVCACGREGSLFEKSSAKTFLTGQLYFASFLEEKPWLLLQSARTTGKRKRAFFFP